MNKKLSIKFISVVISIVMILTMIPIIAFNTGITVKADPFEQMVDLIPERSEIRTELADRPTSINKSENDLETEEEIESDELAADSSAGKTDRYIVKYKDGKKNDFVSKTAELTKSVTSIGTILDDNVGNELLLNKNNGIGNLSAKSVETKNSNISLLVLEEKVLPTELAQTLKNLGVDSDIEYIQPDFELQLDSIDEKTGTETTLEPSLISQVSGDGIPVLVAIIDTGMDANHEALVDYAVDGWNFPADNDVVYDENNPLAYAHGTHIAGIIAETASQVGSNLSIMPLKVFENGSAYTSDIIAAIEYADTMDAKIINCSFGSTQMNQALHDAIDASEALFVCAVGNNRRDLALTPSYPACYKLDNIISVASINADDGFSYFSNYGEDIVDIAALGRDVVSVLPNGEYGKMTGTSMAAAYVTGAAAACYDGQMMTDDLKAYVIGTADVLTNLESKVVDGKRVNLENAIAGVIPATPITPDYEYDFDVHGYNPSASKQFELYSNAGDTIQIAAGEDHTLVLKSNGTVWAWGNNSNGQLGNGTTTNSYVPVKVIGLDTVMAISAGAGHSLAVKSDGTAWAWGYNRWGQLGDGTTTTRIIPVSMMGINDAVDISAGSYHYSMVLRNGGALLACGYGEFSQRGDSNQMNMSSTLLFVMNDVAKVATGYGHTMAIKNDGTLWGWGWNGISQVSGDDTTGILSTPVKVTSISDVKDVLACSACTVVLKNDGTVWTWGYNIYGRLGDGTTAMARLTPVMVADISDIIKISAASNGHNLALKNDGTVWAWGRNDNGQLGDGTTTNQYAPVQVLGLSNVIDISAGGANSVALKSDGTIWTWGSNNYGQLGDGTTLNRLSPARVFGLPIAEPSVTWHATDGTTLNNWNGKYGLDGYILFGFNADINAGYAVDLSSWSGYEGADSYGAKHVPTYTYDEIKAPEYLNEINGHIYSLAVDHGFNNTIHRSTYIAPDSWLDPIERPRAGLNSPDGTYKKMTAAGIFSNTYAPAKTLTFDINDDEEHIVTFYFTSWHGGGYDLTEAGKYSKAKVTFYDEYGNVLLFKDNDNGWGYRWDSNGDDWGDYSHAYVSFKVKKGFSVKIEDSSKWRNLSGVFFDPIVSQSIEIVGEQYHSLAAGSTAGFSTFPLQVQNIEEGAYDVTLVGAPAGLTAYISVWENEGSLIITTDSGVASGVYPLKISIGGIESNTFNLVVADFCINATTKINDLYRLPINCNTNNTRFRVNFEAEYFEIDTSYVVPAGVQIITNTAGEFEFNYTGNQSLVNTLPLRVLKTGYTQISIRKIQ